MAKSLPGSQPAARSVWARLFGRPEEPPSPPLRASLPQTPAQKLMSALAKGDSEAVAQVMGSYEVEQWSTLPSGEIVLDTLWAGAADKQHDIPDAVRQLTKQMLSRGAPLSKALGLRIFDWAVQQKASQYSLCLALLDAGVSAQGVLVTKTGRTESWVRHCLRNERPALALELLRRGADALEVEPDGSTLLHTLASASSNDDHGLFGRLSILMSLGHDLYDRVPRVSDDEPTSDGESRVLVLEHLCAAGVQVAAFNQRQQTAYSLAGYGFRQTLANRPEVVKVGLLESGHSLAYEAVSRGNLNDLSALWNEDRASFTTPDLCGCLPAWAWWSVSNATTSAAVIEWFKAHDMWHESIAFTEEGRRNFLMYGLEKASHRQKPNAAEKAVDVLDWQLARMETELPPQMWFSPDSSGETMSFWFRAMGRDDLVDRYVLPRKEAFLEASLAHVEATQPQTRRPRF